MKTTTVLLCSALSLVLAKPNGVYHQEYNYKSSSSSYKNNELQHKNDDSGYYSKDGDFEGRIKPKVNAHNEHSEYVNPNSQTHSQTGVHYGQNGEMNSYGQMNAQNQDLYGQNMMVEGLNGQSGYGGYGSQSNYGSSSNYGASSYGSQSGYGSTSHMSSSLQSLTARLQAQLERQMQDAIYENQKSSSYSMHSSQSLQNLEDELRRNLTKNLDDEIRQQYGSQSIKNGYTYSIAGGKVQPTANYRNQDLEEWRRQAERNLISKLQNSYKQSSSSSSSSSSSNYNNYQHNNYQPSNTRMYSTLYPNIQTTTYRPYNYQTTTTTNYYSQHNEQSQQIRYTPISNPATITTIAHDVQGDLNEKINEILEEVQRRYFTINAFSLTNFDVVLSKLENELKSNVTYLLDEQLRRNYGTQNLRDGYMYSIGPNGQHSSQYNYSQKDYDHLREQVERNLVQKLKNEFESKKSRYQQTYQSSNSYGSSSYGSSSGSSYGSFGTYGQNDYTSMRPSASNMGSLITAGQRGVKGGNDYRYMQGSSHSGYQTSGGVSDANLAQLQRQLQENLSRSLQQAISKSSSSSAYSSGSRSNLQYNLQQLTEELNRNLTRQLDEARSGYGSTYSTYGSGVSDSQLANLRSQLQNDLQNQLQQGLTKSWSSSSSYSASASSSNYRPVRGSSQYINAMDEEDCQHDDPNAYHSHRQRRHSGYRRTYGQQQVGQQVEDIGQVSEDDDFASLRSSNQRLRNHGNTYGRQQEELGQVVEDDFASLSTSANQRRESQQQYGGQYLTNKHVGQQQEDLGQVVQEDTFGKLEVSNQQSSSHSNVQMGQYGGHHDGYMHRSTTKKTTELGQQMKDDDDFGKLQIGSQTTANMGQQQEDLGQVIEEDTFGKLEVGNQQSSSHSNVQMGQNNRYNRHPTTQKTTELGQQMEDDDDFGKLQVGSQTQSNKLVQGTGSRTTTNMGQQQEDLGQVIEEDTFGKLEVGNQQSSSHSNGQMGQNNRYNRHSTTQKTIELGQQMEDDDDFGKLQVGSQTQSNKLVQGTGSQTTTNKGQQQEDLGQVIEEDTFGKLEVGNQQSTSHSNVQMGQYVGQNNRYTHRSTTQKTTELGQQREDDDDFGKLPVGSQTQSNKLVQGIGSQTTANMEQQQDVLGQVIEEDSFGKLQVGNQQSSSSTTDLEQQVEVDDSKFLLNKRVTEKPVQVGQQKDDDDYDQIQIGAGSGSSSIIKPNKFYNQDQYSDINQQTEDAALGGFSQIKPTQKQQSTPVSNVGPINSMQSGSSSTARPLSQVTNLIPQQVQKNDQTETTTELVSQVSETDQSMVDAEAEAERLIEAIRAAQRNRNQNNRQNSYGSSLYGGYNRNRGDIQPVSVIRSTTEQPENERVYESSTQLNLKPQNTYGSYGSMNSQGNSYSSNSRSSYGYNSMNTNNYKPYNSYNSQTGNSYGNPQLNYGTQHQINDEVVSNGRDVEPLEPQHAVVVEPIAPTSVNSYKPQIGVKGGSGRRVGFVSSSIAPEEAIVEEVASSTQGIETTTEKLSWWKRFGNKVKTGASNLKEKIGI